ncbi:MAG: hypothetical protein AB8F78_16305 [Saprospiraceae bacterium]
MLRTFLDQIFNSVQRYWQFYVLGVLSLFFLMRLHWSFRVLAAIVFLLAVGIAILGAIIGVVDSFSSSSDIAQPHTIKDIAQQVKLARARIADLEVERRRLEAKIQEGGSVSKSERLPSGAQSSKSAESPGSFRTKITLLQEKSAFYKHGLMKLSSLQVLLGKDPKSSNELTKEEELLKSYKQLSKRLDKSDSLENAQLLRKELERLLK